MKTEKAIFGAGCFWGVQYYFDQVPGVVKTTVGYSGGTTVNPTYDDVCTHTTGHAEVVLVEFDPDKIRYEALVRQFFHMHDPSQLDRQGPDIGDSYRTVIFYFGEGQRAAAIKVRNKVQKHLDKIIVTQIEPAGPFYEAEAMHQKFTERTGIGICHIPYEPIN